ncbi:MAG: hypothetical protein ACTH4N_10535 [Corynebacterium casei]|uniref:hypothetical protein n=1 Tax=Corynebacterium casei TaxID=160386 RepID=UPI003F90CF92
MKLKRFTATVAATAIAAGVFIAPASAQDSSEDLSSTFANSSDDSVESPDFEPNPGFEPGEQGSSPTGSSAGDLALIFGVPVVLGKLLTDNVPALRQAVDDIAASMGLQGVSGSSEHNRLYQGGLDFDLERLARTNGLTDVADQLAQIKATSS